MTKARDLADLISTGNALSDGVIDTTELNGVTASAAELNVLDGITVTTEELNNVAGVNSDVQTQLDGKQDVVSGVSDTEIGYLDGVTSNLQTQLDNISVTSGTLTQSFGAGESATITLSSSVSPTAVVAVTKEIGQTGASSKGAWDVNTTASNYELYDEAPATSLSTLGGWDISTASFVQSFSVASQDTGPSDVFFKSDGTEMYVVGTISGGDVSQYTLSTAWDVSTASYTRNFSVNGQETQPQGVFFKSDGTKMYIVGVSGDDVNEYDLSTAWDISTASYSQNFSVSAQEGNPHGIFFKPDGTKMYITGTNGDDVNEYNLSTAWDVSTASYSQNFSVASQDTSPYGLTFKTDGTKMYVLGLSNDSVYEYDLSTAWDVSTASYNQSLSVTSQEGVPTGMFFKPDGTKMYIVGQQGDDVNEYDVSGPLVLGTGSFSSSDVGKRIFVDDGGEAILTATDGSYSLVSAFGASSYTSGNWSLTGLDVDATDGITLSKFEDGPLWELATASFVQSKNLSAQDTQPIGISFKPDGTKMYVLGSNGDDVNEYDLSTAWDISTASYVQNFSVSGQDSFPTSLFISLDGTNMYVTGGSDGDVNQYSLSTAWDISTASYVRNFGVYPETQPRGVFFSSDGLRMYVCGSSEDAMRQYGLGTAWNISTAYFVRSFSVSAQDTTPNGIFFKADGTKMYVVGGSGKDVNEYDLSTAWDVSTASYSQNFSVATQANNPYDIYFKPDGTAFYVIGVTNDSLHEYEIVGALAAGPATAQYLPAITSSAGQIDSTYWTDINSMTADDADNDGQVYYAVSTDDRTTWSIAKASDEVRNIVRNNGGTWQYNSNATYGSTTWTNATTNDEFASIAEAMTVAANQMDKAQVDAVTDGSHFTLGDTLDLAIVPYIASAGTAPTSDGITLNYDAAALNKGAILGTDYDYDVPAGDKVRITALAANNLKVRVV